MPRLALAHLKTIYSRSGKNLPSGRPKRIFNRERSWPKRSVPLSLGAVSIARFWYRLILKKLRESAPLDDVLSGVGLLSREADGLHW
jgi:hypothetical protein